MNKEELWDAFLKRYPQFKEDETLVKMKPRGLRRLIDQAWDEGHEKGLVNGKALESMKNAASAKKDPFGVGNMFGGMR